MDDGTREGAEGRRIVVTGAGGFIGAALCRRLVADGDEVVGLDRSPAVADRVQATGATFRAADVTDPAGVAAAVEGADGVIHTAALVSDWGAMADFVRVNVGGTRTVLDAAQAAGVRRVVHLSSVATWGYEFRGDLASEDAPARVCGAPYVDTKTASHLLALGRGAAVVRPGDVYGPHSEPWTSRPVRMLRAGRFVLPGDGGGILTPVYVDDLVDCVVLALRHPDAGGRAVTAHDGSPVTAREFFGHYARMLGQGPVRTLPAPLLRAAALAFETVARRTGGTPDVTRQALTYITRRGAYPNTAARDLLGWEPRVDLAEGMRRTEAWLRDDGLLG
ncbi:SDR family NAD(P)-dependent oxidoreductase [Conexibacter sp. W3-3-2]|uniref:NAD-dependent epimerase/dehydratase family protein n=1 Tax=Conexibacter sp. W3-3-2 TaxID=2675227 RepID=UPI0012B7DFCB|nr:NAD(P)-dependent oxidoreductase [Conexibacter sp. W3-3-2]MTD47103.1 SDR family NAD(P)-dependent oxidoreductase [Conexibacter sp. W3-3-2]